VKDMKEQNQEPRKNEADAVRPCVRCGGTDKAKRNDSFCRHCQKAILSIMNE